MAQREKSSSVAGGLGVFGLHLSLMKGSLGGLITAGKNLVVRPFRLLYYLPDARCEKWGWEAKMLHDYVGYFPKAA